MPRLCLTEHMNAHDKTLELLIERLAGAQLELTQASNAYQKHIEYQVLMELGDMVKLDLWKLEVSAKRIALLQAGAKVEAYQDAYDLAVWMEDDPEPVEDEAEDDGPRYRVLTRNGDEHVFGIWDEESMNYVSFTGVTGMGVTSTMSKDQAEAECARLNAEDKS